MSKLKPCPFCGGEAELCYGPGLGTDSCRGYTLYASCSECGAKLPGLWQEKKPEPNDQSWKDAADEWNSRPGEPDLENCGVACCEHHPEGLPVCGKCREESQLAHDKACALLAEARAEIEALKRVNVALNGEIKIQRAYVTGRDNTIERKDKLVEQMVGALNHCKSTFEDYVEIHKAKMPVVTIDPIPPKWGDVQRKIARNQEAFDLCNAALSAAERGE